MTRINPVEIDTADSRAKTQLEGVRKSLGGVPNLIATLGHSPATLGFYLGAGQALAGGSLDAALREQIALTVAGANSCEYCASAHTALGKGQGVDDQELSRNLEGRSDDPKVGAALAFSRAVVDKRGWVSDEELASVRDAGFTEGQITEIVATIALNIFTNYFNHIAGTEIDFPRVEVPEPALA